MCARLQFDLLAPFPTPPSSVYSSTLPARGDASAQKLCQPSECSAHGSGQALTEPLWRSSRDNRADNAHATGSLLRVCVCVCVRDTFVHCALCSTCAVCAACATCSAQSCGKLMASTPSDSCATILSRGNCCRQNHSEPKRVTGWNANQQQTYTFDV